MNNDFKVFKGKNTEDDFRIFIFPQGVEYTVIKIYKGSILTGFLSKADCKEMNEQLLKAGYVTKIDYDEIKLWNIHIEELNKE